MSVWQPYCALGHGTSGVQGEAWSFLFGERLGHVEGSCYSLQHCLLQASRNSRRAVQGMVSTYLCWNMRDCARLYREMNAWIKLAPH